MNTVSNLGKGGGTGAAWSTVHKEANPTRTVLVQTDWHLEAHDLDSVSASRIFLKEILPLHPRNLLGGCVSVLKYESCAICALYFYSELQDFWSLIFELILTR